jgi:hypothetical protein
MVVPAALKRISGLALTSNVGMRFHELIEIVTMGCNPLK